jgi:hypothetical protein
MTRTELHQLLDAIPDDALDRAREALEPLADPFLVMLAAADVDDEPEMDDERAAVDEARLDIAAGRVRPWEEVRSQLAGE